MREAIGVGFVNGVDFALGGHAHAVVTEDEGADGGVESEAVDAVAGGVDKNSGRAVNDVAGGDLLGSGLKDGGADVIADVGGFAKDGEDGADIDVDVDVGGAVEGVEDDDVFAGGGGAVEDEGLFVFFGDEGGDAVTKAEAVEEGLVGVDVEFLLGFAVDVGFASRANDVVAEAGAADFGLDHFSGEGEAREEPGEAAAGFGVAAALLKHDVLLDGDDHVFGLYNGGGECRAIGENIASAPPSETGDTATTLDSWFAVRVDANPQCPVFYWML